MAKVTIPAGFSKLPGFPRRIPLGGFLTPPGWIGAKGYLLKDEL